ncbi:DNAJ protein JJJ1 homolog [Lycium barbarum]|uniref:DNAJ protein JJJ1 homolog n=1 Tax=Lycium barbarum TaxID=112863 RepID=UPI00293E5678|nr:DNAJ protein JJJ1 homolog [Lycium barbarum]
MASSEKRCLYEVLGVNRDVTADEIRSAYRKLALQRHPDKLVRSGVPESEATASFQELVNAYEVLSDARERAWYDSHRSQILFSNSGPANSGSNSGPVPDLFSFFSNSVYNGYSDKGKGFYKVYGDLFDKIYQTDLNFARKLGTDLPKEAPLMGNLDSPYAQATAFYSYWSGFVTVMDFCWVDQYDVMAGPNRKSRRIMEDENKKLRKKAKREYNETVRGLAEFVKKRDKRVIDMQLKKNEEMEKKKEEERKRKKELERQKAERAKKYVEPEWTKVEELEDEEFEEDSDEDEKKKADVNELYCVACSKKFKSEKQWKNHEQSKKHKEKVAALREAFDDEDDEYEGLVDDGASEEQNVADADRTTDLSADDGVDELAEHLEGSTRIQEDEREDDEVQSSEEDETTNYQSGSNLKGVADELVLDDDEASVLESMISGRKSRKNAGPGGSHQTSAKNVQGETGNDEMDFMEYNNLRSTRRNRGGRRQRNRRPQEEEEEEEAAGGGGDVNSGRRQRNRRPQEEEEEEAGGGAGDVRFRVAEVGTDSEVKSACNDSSACQEPSSQPSAETANDHKGDDVSGNSEKVTSHGTDKKTTAKKEKNNKSKDATKGRKQKAKSKSSSNLCDTCGEEFDSRNQLHKHLGSTGHAKLKSR